MHHTSLPVHADEDHGIPSKLLYQREVDLRWCFTSFFSVNSRQNLNLIEFEFIKSEKKIAKFSASSLRVKFLALGVRKRKGK